MRVRAFLIALGVLIVCCGPVAASDVSLNVGSREQQAIFLAGAAQAFTLTNLQTELGGTPLYCSPLDYVLSTAEMYRLAGARLIGPHDPPNFLIAVLGSLREEFPCE